MIVPEGRFPTHRAYPDCFGFRGGPRGVEGILPVLEFELSLRPADKIVSYHCINFASITCLPCSRA